jgi:hypothetical protein
LVEGDFHHFSLTSINRATTTVIRGGKNMYDSQLTPVLEEKSLSEVIRERRSVRYYNPDAKISRDVLTEILQQATLAPSGGNL